MELNLPKKIIPMREFDRIEFLKEIKIHPKLSYATHWSAEVILPKGEAGFRVAFFLANGSERISAVSRPLFVTKETYSLIEIIEKFEEIAESGEKNDLFKNKNLNQNRLMVSFKRKRFYFIPKRNIAMN